MERKLTAILCADVYGYSRLMGQDEEGDPPNPIRLPQDYRLPDRTTPRQIRQFSGRQRTGRIRQRGRGCFLRRRDSGRLSRKMHNC
jgi:hypothetical protein